MRLFCLRFEWYNIPIETGALKDTLHVRDGRLSAGEAFIVPFRGELMTMPGLAHVPAANGINRQPVAGRTNCWLVLSRGIACSHAANEHLAVECMA